MVYDKVFSQVFDKFVRVCDTLWTRFRLFLSKTWSRTCCINLDVRSSLGFKQVCSWLSPFQRHVLDLLATCFRRAHASRKPGLQPGLQLARIMECGLKSVNSCKIEELQKVTWVQKIFQSRGTARDVCKSLLSSYTFAVTDWRRIEIFKIYTPIVETDIDA